MLSLVLPIPPIYLNRPHLTFHFSVFHPSINVNMFNFNLFKSSPAAEAECAHENSWNGNTVAMQQPSSPAAPSTENVVSEQPVRSLPE